MLTPKLRGLLNKKNSKFEWTIDHQLEYDRVMESYSNLEKLQPYKPGNRIFGLTDASYQGLGFILFQEDENKHVSILQVGSTCLKNAQVRWHPTELELLAMYYCLSKCEFYTLSSINPITIYSDCSGLKGFELMDITTLTKKRMISLKDKLQSYNY